MRFPALFAAFALLAATPVAMSASDTVVNRGGDPLIVPAASGLHFKTTDGEGTSKFDGRILLSGTYYYEAGEDADSTALRLVPDRETRVPLPHYKDHGTPDSVFLSDAPTFARAAGISKRAKSARGKTQVWADRFEAGIECDVPFFNARFVEIARPSQKFAAKDMEDNGC